MNPVVQFVVICLLAAIFLWALSQFPSLDGTIVRFIRIAIVVLLSVLLLDLLLVLLFARHLSGFLGG